MSLIYKMMQHCNKRPGVVEIVRQVASSPLLYKSQMMQKFFLSRAARYDRKGIGPDGIYLEVSLTCNARCVMCNHHYDQMVGNMDMDLFRKIVDDCTDHNIKTFGLDVYGEPLLDKHLFERADYIKSKGGRFFICTNGSLLNEERSRRLLATENLIKVNVSLNAFHPETYTRITGGLDGQVTFNNVQRFLEMREFYSGNRPLFSVSFVSIDMNRNEKNDFVRYWQIDPRVDQIVIGDLMDRVGRQDPETIGKLEKMHRSYKWMPPCHSVWGALFVYYDGRVSPCNEDLDNRDLIVGDFRSHTLTEIQNGLQLRKLRDMHLQNKRCECEICGKCSHLRPFFW